MNFYGKFKLELKILFWTNRFNFQNGSDYK